MKLLSKIEMVLMCDEETRFTKKTNNDGVIMTHNYTPKSNTYTQTSDRASKWKHKQNKLKGMTNNSLPAKRVHSHQMMITIRKKNIATMKLIANPTSTKERHAQQIQNKHMDHCIWHWQTIFTMHTCTSQRPLKQ